MNLDIKQIKILLAQKGLTNAEFASLAGLARQNISTLLKRGRCNPKTVGKLANALNCDVSDIVKD